MKITLYMVGCKMVSIVRLLYIIIFSALLLFGNNKKIQSKHILVLNSYHQTFGWVKDIQRAIDDVLKPIKNNYILHVENMDTKRIYSSAYIKALKNIYQIKYKDIKFDIILASDNNAYDFLRHNRDDIFGDVPTLFCGVNFFNDNDIKGLHNFTGVAENTEPKGTIKSALKMFPNTKHVFILNDYLKTGQAFTRITIKAIKDLNLNLDVRIIENLTKKELQVKLSKLPKNSIVILGTYFQDRDKIYYDFKQSGTFIPKYSNAPVFCLVDLSLGYGVVGGSLVGGYYQGFAMAKMAKKVLEGADINTMAVAKHGSTKFVFDYNALKKYNIDFDILPKNSKIINKPIPFFQQYKLAIEIALLIITILIIAIIVLLVQNRKIKIAQEKLKKIQLNQKQLIYERTKELEDQKEFVSSIITSSQDALIVIDKTSNVTMWNASATVIFGYTEEEMVGSSVEKIIPDEFKKLHFAGVKRVSENGETKLLGKGAIEIIGVHKDGTIKNIDLALNSFMIKEEIFYSANIRDISDRKELTDRIQKEKEFTQTIVDSQEQLILTTNGEKILTTNKTFLNFYAVDSIEDFMQIYDARCICDTFDKNAPEGYLQKDMGGEIWIDYVISNSSKIHKAIIIRDKKPFIFSVSATKLPGDNETLLAVFTNITEMEEAKKEVEILHKHTKESIEYASLIQGAVVSKPEDINLFFKSSFVYWMPKDTVGGDIWLLKQLRHEDECILFVIDCTGHGVPGAFVTMIVKSIEREIVANLKKHPEFDISPAIIMSHFNKTMKILLKQTSKDSLSNAGWDGAIIYYNRREQVLKFAGAKTPLFYIDKNGEFKTLKGNRYSVGYKKCDMDYVYKESTMHVQEGMKFYCTTDGYFDQNGGEKGFPFGKKRFENIIKRNHSKLMTKQKDIFVQQLQEYESQIPNNDRNDDITLVGFEIGAKSNIVDDVAIVKYKGVMTQSVIASALENIETSIANIGLMGTISTITIDYCRNMMYYPKNEEAGSRQIVPIGKIDVQLTNNNYYEIVATNIVSVEDKEKIKSKLVEIKKLDKEGIKKRYRELRRSGARGLKKHKEIGLYKIARVSDAIEYDFIRLNEDKYTFMMKSIVKAKKYRGGLC